VVSGSATPAPSTPVSGATSLQFSGAMAAGAAAIAGLLLV
jgi:hypothetical protein